jgi:hypothetical protein
MSRLWLAAMIGLVALITGAASAQTTHLDSAHTTLAPATPDPGRTGQVVTLPQGGQGVTTGGTAHYQTLVTPGGSATAIPNSAGGSTVIGSGGHGGIGASHP